MHKKCPYCFEDLETRTQKCKHCDQFLLDDLVSVDYPSVEKKKCIFCGKKIPQEAIFCKHCRRWLDEVNRAAEDVKEIEGFEELE